MELLGEAQAPVKSSGQNSSTRVLVHVEDSTADFQDKPWMQVCLMGVGGSPQDQQNPDGGKLFGQVTWLLQQIHKW